MFIDLTPVSPSDQAEVTGAHYAIMEGVNTVLCHHHHHLLSLTAAPVNIWWWRWHSPVSAVPQKVDLEIRDLHYFVILMMERFYFDISLRTIKTILAKHCISYVK